MESEATSSLPYLLNLKEHRDVNNITTFMREAKRIDPEVLAEEYSEVRRLAPQRHKRDPQKLYLVDHIGSDKPPYENPCSEKHLAFNLWKDARSGKLMELPSGGVLEILDYETPLTARQSEGVGEIDLFGLIDDRLMAVIELKILREGGDVDTPLHAFLEALAYCAMVEKNASDIACEVDNKFKKTVDAGPPNLVVMAPANYWSKFLNNPKVGDWLPILINLASEIENRTGVATHFVGLDDSKLFSIAE